MIYKITRKTAVCKFDSDYTVKSNCRTTDVFECLECPNKLRDEEVVGTFTEEQYIRLLKDGNCFITKVEIIEN